MSDQTKMDVEKDPETVQDPAIEDLAETVPAEVTDDGSDEAALGAEIDDRTDDQLEPDDPALETDGVETPLPDREPEIKELYDRLARQVAEFQNYRRRTENDVSRAAQFGREDVIKGLLDVYDDLRRSIEAAEKMDMSDKEFDHDSYSVLLSGVKLVHQKFSEQLTRFGVQPIEAEGQLFDESRHEALMQQPATEDVASGGVITELQKGYMIGERVLRHSKVIVAQ